MADVLTIQELSAKLAYLDSWKLAGTAITKTFELGSFGESIRFVNQVTKLAEAKDHHPDIDIRYDKVTLTLSTHSAGGVTERDTELATQIEAAAA